MILPAVSGATNAAKRPAQPNADAIISGAQLNVRSMGFVPSAWPAELPQSSNMTLLMELILMLAIGVKSQLAMTRLLPTALLSSSRPSGWATR